MNLHEIDLNLLAAFNAVAKEGSVSAAAKRAGLSQPAMSNALSRLRRLFNDPLFVRTPTGMQPTPLAQQLLDPVASACQTLEDAIRGRLGFEPSTSLRRFVLLMSDVGQLVFLPIILEHIQRSAPRVTLDVRRVPESGIYDMMAIGEADLAIGIFPRVRTGMYQQWLYKDRFVCVARKDHPSLRGELTAAAYKELPHAVVGRSGTDHDVLIERALARAGIKRKIVITVPHLVPLPGLVARSDVIATIPFRMVDAMGLGKEVRMHELPLKIPPVEIRQYWHERQHHDSANRWLREAVASILKE